MGKSKRRKMFRYLPDAPIDTSFIMEIIKLSRQEFIAMLSLDANALTARSEEDAKFGEIMFYCLKFIKQMQDQSLPTKLCLLCDYEYDHITPPAMMVILRPDTLRRHNIMFNVLCPRCANQSNDVLDTKILAHHKKEFPGFSFRWDPSCD